MAAFREMTTLMIMLVSGAAVGTVMDVVTDMSVRQTTVFHTNCTGPASDSSFNVTANTLNFVAGPNTRGTLQILYSCIFTLLICSWNVQHLNVPPLDSSARALFLKPLYMIATLTVPELIVGIALTECVQAWRSVRYMKRMLPELVEHGGWTMTHAYYAGMYGFLVRKRVAPEPEPGTSMFRSSVIRRSDLLVLNTERMVTYLRSLPPPINFVTETDIQCRAKGDIFLKCTAALQISWFIVQMSARKARHLQISQLEIWVLAHAICTLVSYLLWIKKPQNVSVPIILDEGPGTLPSCNDWIDARWELDCYGGTEDDEGFKLPLGMEARLFEVGLSLGGVILGTIHLLAWNVHFASDTDETFWRISAIVTIALPPLLLAFSTVGKFATLSVRGVIIGAMYIIFWASFRDADTTFWRIDLILAAATPLSWALILLILLSTKFATTSVLGRVVTVTAIMFYSIGRKILMRETYRCLWYLPAGAFTTVTWSTYIPHVM